MRKIIYLLFICHFMTNNANAAYDLEDLVPDLIERHKKDLVAKRFLVSENITTFGELDQKIQYMWENDVESWLSLASAFRHMGRDLWPWADFIYEQTLFYSCSPYYNAKSLLGRAKIKALEGNTEEAKNFAYQSIEKDSSYIRTYLWLGDILATSQHEESFQNYNLALDEAKKTGDLKLQIKANLGLAKISQNHKVNYYAHALFLAEEAEDRKLQLLANAGLINTSVTNRIAYYKNELTNAEQKNNLYLEAKAHIKLGKINFRKNPEHYRIAINIARKIPNRKLEAEALIGFHNALRTKNCQMLLDAMVIAKEIEDLFLQAQIYLGLGNARYQGIQTELYSKSLLITKQLGDQYLQAQSHMGLGNARAPNREYHYNRALEIAQQLCSTYIQAQALIGLGNINKNSNNYTYAYNCYFQASKMAAPSYLLRKASDGLKSIAKFLQPNVPLCGQKRGRSEQDAYRTPTKLRASPSDVRYPQF
jgi:hypothetical protein